MLCLVPIGKVATVGINGALCLLHTNVTLSFLCAFNTCADIRVYYALTHLEMSILRKAPFCVSLSLPFSLSLRVRACACVCVCVSFPHSSYSPPVRRGAQRRSSGFPSVLRPLHTLTLRCIRGASPGSFHQFPPFFGSSHAAVVALDTGHLDEYGVYWGRGPFHRGDTRHQS